VVVKCGAIEGRRGTVKEILDQGMVLIEQQYGYDGINVGISTESWFYRLNCL
jgi:hypothetical protein